jgi:hypothetical protein
MSSEWDIMKTFREKIVQKQLELEIQEFKRCGLPEEELGRYGE